VKRFDEKCTIILRTLTSAQIEAVQEMINENFSDGLNAEQVPKALKLTLELVEDMMKDKSEAEEIDKEILEQPIKSTEQPTADMKNIQSTKANEEASKLDNKPNYIKGALSLINCYIEEPGNVNNDDGNETWYFCNNEIPEE
ncbi:23767_t:CDS:2, partial [Dentiscutata erythropus]